MGIAEIPTAAPVIMGRLVIAGPESRHGLKLGGTAELIRPKWNGYSIWGFFTVKVKLSAQHEAIGFYSFIVPLKATCQCKSE